MLNIVYMAHLECQLWTSIRWWKSTQLVLSSRDILSLQELIALCKNALIACQLMRWYLGVCQTARHMNYVKKFKPKEKETGLNMKWASLKRCVSFKCWTPFAVDLWDLKPCMMHKEWWSVFTMWHIYPFWSLKHLKIVDIKFFLQSHIRDHPRDFNHTA